MKYTLALLVVFAAAPLSVRSEDVPPVNAPAPAPAPAAPDAAPAAKAAVAVDKLVLTTGIKDRQPIDESATFSAGFPVYAWAKFSASATPATVKYVWSKDGKKSSEYPVELKSASTRWWASKKVSPGAWKVELVSDGGESLASASFTVTAADAAPAKAPAPATGDASPAAPVKP
jgi:hypothetical protein